MSFIGVRKRQIPEEVGVKLCVQIALTISVLFKNCSLSILLAVRLLSLTAEKWMQSMGETKSFYTIGSSEGWISSEVRASSSVSDAVCSVFLLLTVIGLLLACTSEMKRSRLQKEYSPQISTIVLMCLFLCVAVLSLLIPPSGHLGLVMTCK